MKLTKKIMKCNKKVVSVLLSLAILLTVFSIPVVSAVTTDVKESRASSTAVSSSANQYGLQDNIQDGTMLHCFNWKYTDIKAELKNIAEAGFTAVQTSPAQANNNSGTWYWLYQPRGFYVGTNDLGTKDQLRDLCTEADKYGIKVVVDVVANHLQGDHYNIVEDLKPSQYWHHNGSVGNWKDRFQVTHGDIGMQDIATENSYVQECVKKYIEELKSLGVDGMRFDAAKHIGLPSEGDDFWSVVTSDKSLFYYGEILGGPDDRETGNEELMKEYTDYISVTDSGYSYDNRIAFNSGKAPSTKGNWAVRGVSADKLVYWAESHDNWSNNSDFGYSWNISQNNIDRAYAIAAARSGATALYFSRPSTHDKENIKAGKKGSTHFTSPEVAAVNHFHNAMVGQKDSYVNSNNCGVVCREEGAVIVKGSGSGQVTVTNAGGTTKPGVYVDEITGSKWTVTPSTISGTIGSTGIAVIYNPTLSAYNTISQAGGTFKSETLTLTLGIENATSGTYQIDNGAVQTYTGTKTITIGEGVSYGSTITLKLTATGENGTTETSYTFKKVDPLAVRVIDFSNKNTVYLWNTASWSTQNCYSWQTGRDGATAWPGSAMTKVDTFGGYDLYKFTVPSNETNIIFNNGSTKTDDMTIQTGTVVFDNGTGQWVDATTMDDDVAVSTDPIGTTSGTKPTTYTTVSQTNPTTVGEEYLYGDVNLDKEIDIRDVSAIQKFISSHITFSEIQRIAADVNADGYIDISDATLVQKYVVGKVSSFPIGSVFFIGQTTASQTTTY